MRDKVDKVEPRPSTDTVTGDTADPTWAVHAEPPEGTRE